MQRAGTGPSAAACHRDEADIASQRQRLAALLQGVGAPSLEDAERLLAERRDAEARLAEVTSRLKASAPDGIERLQRTQTELATQVATQ